MGTFRGRVWLDLGVWVTIVKKGVILNLGSFSGKLWLYFFNGCIWLS